METTIPTEPRQGTKHRLLLIGSVLAVILVVAAGLLYFLLGTGKTFSLQGVRYLEGTFDARVLKELSLSGSQEVLLPVPGRVIDYARAGDSEAAIVLLDDAVQAVYVQTNGEWRAVVERPGIRGGLSLSPDGNTLAYAERKADIPVVETPLEFYDPASWVVRVLTLDTGSEAQMGDGYGTTLFVREGALHLAYGAPLGIHIANLVTGMQDTVPLERGGFSKVSTILSSEDGTHILIPSVMGDYELYLLKEIENNYVLERHERQPVDARAAAFKNGQIFVLTTTEGNSMFGTAAIENSVEVSLGEKKPSMLVTKIIP